MANFAIIENGKVTNIAVADSALAENWVQSDIARVGWLYDGSAFSAPLQPEVVITSLSVSGQQTPLSSRVILSAGQSVAVTARIEAGGLVLPKTDRFAVPICRVRGDVDQTVNVQFYGGVAEFSVQFPRSGEYAVLPEWLNMHLPADQQLAFQPFYISVTA